MIERALVGAQHEENVKHARACENCHRYVGTVSSAVGTKAAGKVRERGAAETDDARGFGEAGER